MGTPGDQRRLRHLNDSDPLLHQEEHRRNDDHTQQPPQPVAPPPPATIVKNEFHPHDAIKTEPLEQTYIDSYFPEQKNTHTNIKPEDIAGPSGLQTPNTALCPKTKSNITPKKIKKTPSKKQYVCAVCQKCFQNVSKFAKHQQVHGSGSPFKCEHCKKSFSSKFKLVRHVLIHSDRKPFSCTMCERTFHRKDHLKNHIKVHSPCKKLYVCDNTSCKKEYTSLISFRKHLAFHAAEDGALNCLICEKSFETKEEILYHLKVHAGSRTVKNPDEKKYCCDHCDRKFFTRKDVRRHMVVHTGRRDFLCQFCPQRFGRKDHLVRHIKKSHSKATDSDVEVKTEQAATGVAIKAEADESSLSQPEDFTDGLDLDSLLQPLSGYLPPAHPQGELADLGREVLDVIPDPLAGNALDASIDDIQANFFNYLEDDVRETAPLPAFSQIFQHQPPQLPQPPSPR
ncbi:gastrula zinc finger protein XlCGF26.1-like [Atheta coriaria]|uniref:gastrula zinc finger protein XlCGF26.1-like n=1 Tax=Dalotia coriaria TaxID=877792 RepID=UPI0031F34424